MEPSASHLSVRQLNPLHVSVRQLPPPPYEAQDNLSFYTSHNVRLSSLNVPDQSSLSKGPLVKTTMSSFKQKVSRPLPVIPSPSTLESSIPPRTRPLPSPPCTYPRSATPHKIVDDVNSSSMPDSDILDSLPRQPPARLESSSLVASALKPLETQIESQLSPIPDLSTAHISRPSHPDLPLHHLSRLRPNRPCPHVDELILDELDGWEASMIKSFPDTNVCSDDRLDGQTYVKTAILENILDMISEKDVEETHEEGKDEMVRIDCFQTSKDAKFPSNTRFSCHWLREKRGRRWEEEDYRSVLNTLRSL